MTTTHRIHAWVACAAFLGSLVGTPPATAQCTGGGLGPHNVLGAAIWEGESNEAFALMGYAARTAGDVNGDGFSDALVGIPLKNGTFLNEGRVELFLGSSTGGTSTADWFAVGTGINTFYGLSVSTAGDVNGDGYDDVIIGEPGYTNGESMEGRAYVYRGSASGLSNTPSWTVELDVAAAQFGYSVSTAGDVNDDGYDDVIVGAPGIGDAGTLFEGQGAAYVFLGSASGLSTGFQVGFVGGQKNAHFGWSVCTAGDVNGDGYADVIVCSEEWPVPAQSIGKAWVYLGSATGLSTTSAWSAEGPNVGSLFGHRAAAGDLNGDGYSDVLVDGYGYVTMPFEGVVRMFLGGPNGPSLTPDWERLGGQAAAYMEAVACAGDVDADGYADVAVGAEGYTNSAGGEGIVWIYRGGPTGLGAVPSDSILTAQVNTLFGARVAGAGDVNGDGHSDVLVGAPWYDNPSTNEGGVFLYMGSPTGIVYPGVIMATGGAPDVNLGGQVATAGDTDGDGFPDVIVGGVGWNVDEGEVFVFRGNGRSASERLTLSPRQRTASGDPIPLLGRATDPTQLSMYGRSAAGRMHVRLEWSVAELGTPHPNVGTLEPWLDTGAVDPVFSSRVALEHTVSLPASDAPYTWRMRITGESPFFPHSPWHTQSYAVPTLEVMRSPMGAASVPSPLVTGRPVIVKSVVPNPLDRETVITYSVSAAGPVDVGIWDVRGRRVATLVHETRPAGESRVRWGGLDAQGHGVPAEVYFVRVRTALGTAQRKIAFLR